MGSRKKKKIKKKDNMDKIKGSATSDPDPPPVDPAGAVNSVTILDSSTLPSLKLGIAAAGYTTPTPSDKSEYESP